jgi:hypothetical protein
LELNKEINRILRQYGKDSYLVPMNNGDVYSSVSYKVRYKRLETDEEYKKRLKNEEAAQKEKENYELAELERLKAKYKSNS